MNNEKTDKQAVPSINQSNQEYPELRDEELQVVVGGKKEDVCPLIAKDRNGNCLL